MMMRKNNDAAKIHTIDTTEETRGDFHAEE